MHALGWFGVAGSAGEGAAAVAGDAIHQRVFFLLWLVCDVDINVRSAGASLSVASALSRSALVERLR